MGSGPSRWDPPADHVSQEEAGQGREAGPAVAAACVRDEVARLAPSPCGHPVPPHLVGDRTLLCHVLDQGDEQLLSPVQRSTALTQGQGGPSQRPRAPPWPQEAALGSGGHCGSLGLWKTRRAPAHPRAAS